MIARTRSSDKQAQSILSHSLQTATLCARYMSKLGFEKLGYLTGLLHDCGKYTECFYTYLNSHLNSSQSPISRGEVHHAPTGAIYAFEHWYRGTRAESLAAQLIAMVIYGHHSGLMDAVAVDGSSPLLEKLSRNKDELHYHEAVGNFLCNVCAEEELDRLFSQAKSELEAKKAVLSDFNLGLLARALLSSLIDADRWDSACFEYREDSLAEPPAPDWSAACNALENHLSGFPPNKPLSNLRRQISDFCLLSADNSPGIYKLTVPTGGGKTLASLRFALRHAKKHGFDRIFYIIPFNAILDQNTKEIRDALGETVRILEHHSNVVLDDDSLDELENHQRLTERWDADLILTSMVQFLNAFYRKENTAARRMCHLAHSVIVFDEIQSLPRKCTRLFEKAVRFLVAVCGCTVVLSTATQPYLKLEQQEKMPCREIIPDADWLFAALRRTRLIDESREPKSTEQAAEEITALMEKHGAVLVIVNTKRMARRLYELSHLHELPCTYLTTDMYPAHRLELIEKIRNRGNAPLLCISTSLIEAGINISFPCVVRILAGFGNILQAAGRCNRNAELPDGTFGQVHIWKLAEESLRGLPEISRAQKCTTGLLAGMSTEAASSPDGLAAYFEIERKEFSDLEDFPERTGGVNVTLLDLFDKNRVAPPGPIRSQLSLFGAYRTAQTLFQVITNESQPVLVAHGKGEEIAASLSDDLSMHERIKYLRQAQQYSVSLFPNVFCKLQKENGVWFIENAGVYVLRKEYYNDETGLTMEAQIMEDLQY